MKKILFLVVALLLSLGSTMAQDLRSNSTEKVTLDDVMEMLKEKQKTKLETIKNDAFSTNSQVRIGTGFVLPVVNYFNTEDVFYRQDGNSQVFDVTGFAFNVEYSYRVWDFLELVGSFHYWGGTKYNEFRVTDDYYNDELLRTFTNDRRLSFGVYGRYNWFNTKWVSMYSTLGCWVLTTTASCYDHRTQQRETHWFTHSYLLPEFTPFGIRVGRQFFGFFEPYSISARGNLMNIGVGFRF